jgi:UDP-N-acetylmuramoyl-tripeptide--D-alanyl-D-alanine ligase
MIGGKEVAARVGAPGRHTVQNALAVLGAADLVGADVEKVALSLESLVAGSGRGKRHVLKHPEGPITLIDESYNANPASMQAAMALLDATPVTGEGRRIAVLGDMLELGSHSAKLHAGLAELVAGTRTDLILLAGPEMKSLAEALPQNLAFEYRSGADELKPVLIETVRPGDVVMIKSSKGIGFSKLVDALIRQFPAEAGNAKPS